MTGVGVLFYIEKGSESMSGKTRLTATLQYSADNSACTSQSTSVKLNRNEHVWVFMGNQYTLSQMWEDSSQAWHSFTGTLIQEL
ncbi:hypothetical protein DPMN_050821 [Dreissena polymorpha]|uniref:Uncharacterized protein n=1 Tax=Dreissena polymorpha TaxID=45954 RepID=A0A9D4HPP0_DREPO|nr:hypothetical protein DPMN_050821 [Dreissena polymorpha]